MNQQQGKDNITSQEETHDQYGASRQVIHTASAEFEPYNYEGPVQENMSQLSLSYDPGSGQGAYLIRMEPGAETIRHVHRRREEYLILEGDVVESDGTVLGPGDYVIYQPGTTHNSRTVNGCLIYGVDFSLAES